MSREFWYILGAIAVVALLAAVVAVKKVRPHEWWPDRGIGYKIVEGENFELHAFFADDTRGLPSDTRIDFVKN